MHRKPQGLIILDDSCRISKADGANTFEIATAGNDGGGKGKNGTLDREKYHLLNLSDSEINDSAEDLKLPSPSATGGALITTLNTSYKTPAGAITNSVPTAAGRIRRKIRLKR